MLVHRPSRHFALRVLLPFRALARRGALRLAGLGLALAAPVGAPASGRAQESPIDLGRAEAYLREAERIGSEDGGRLWGAPLHGPVLFVHPGTRFAVGNLRDAEGTLSPSPRAGVYAGTLPRDLTLANTAMEWGGHRWTMILWPPPEDDVERRRLLAHEMFHRVQPSLGLPMADPPSPHLTSAEGRTWLRLEWRALARALRATGAERAGSVADALAFRAHRHARFPGAAAAERALELNEGLAEYTGAALSGRGEAELRQDAAERLRAFEGRESLVRSFAYASGPAYGLLLDAAGAEWRSAIAADADLGALLARAYGLPEPAGDGAERRAEEYGGAAVAREEAERAERVAARQAELRARFVAAPRLVLPMAGDLRFSFDPNSATVIDGVGTVYESAQVTAAWGILTVERGGVLFLQGERGFTGVAVPVPAAAAGPPRAGPGWHLDLAEGWQIQPGDRAGQWTTARTQK